jgi:hypothetical protein
MPRKQPFAEYMCSSSDFLIQVDPLLTQLFVCCPCMNRYLRATDPFSLPDLRDEALCLNDLGRWEEAGELLREYLVLAPAASDSEMVGEVLQQVELRVAVSQEEAYKRRMRRKW